MALEPGQQFGRYEMMFRLGQGGMAETWRARLLGEAGGKRPVLIKKILPEYANDEAFITLFVSEARISATLSHGNIAQVYDFGRWGDEYFLAMEFVDGQPLHRILRRARRSGLPTLPVPIATAIALEMCQGLHYAHTRQGENGQPLGIVHRDISPDNVLLSYEGQVKIVDFGIAKARELRGFNTEPGIVKGKYLYFSPEQARGEEVDARTDVWAAGVVLYEMLCGELPVQGQQHTALPLLVKGEFPRPQALNPELPEGLDQIVMRALAVRREERYESCHAFGDALAGFLHSVAPRFSGMTLAHFMQELFREDLSVSGRTVQVPHSFQEQFALWRSGPRPSASAPSVSQAPAATGAMRPPRTAWKWGAGGVGLALLATGILFAIPSGYHPHPHEEAASSETAPRPDAPIGVDAAGDRPPPARVQSLPAREAYKQAYTLFKTKQYREAADRAEVCLNFEPGNPECQLLAGDAFAALDKRTQASEHYTQFLKLAPHHEAAPRVGKLLRQYDQEPAPAPPQQPKEAQAEASQPPVHEDVPPPSHTLEVSRLLRKAQLQLNLIDYPGAVKTYRQVLELEPDSTVAKESLAFGLLLTRRDNAAYREIETLLQDVVKAKEFNPRAWYVLGTVFENTARYKEARDAFQNYLVLAPYGRFAMGCREGADRLKNR